MYLDFDWRTYPIKPVFTRRLQLLGLYHCLLELIMMYSLRLGLIFAVVGFVSSADFSCNGEESYLYPVESDCRLYYACAKGSTEPSLESCSWFFHEFDPVDLRCNWCWKVDCSASPAPPPTAAPTTTSTPAPASTSTAAPSTAASTAAPSTAASTAAPSTAVPTAVPSTAASTAAPTAATTKADAKTQSLDSLMINRLKRQ